MNHAELLKTRPVGDIDDASVKKITETLNHILANEYALFTKTLNYHWNVTGPRFHSLHTFLDGQYRELLEIMDSLAERVRVLDATPYGTVKKMLAEMDLHEKSGKEHSANEMLKNLFSDNIKIQTLMKEAISHEDLFSQDPGTQDFLVGLLKQHEKMSWMLKSHLD